MNNQIKKLKLQAGIEDNPDQEGIDLFAQLLIEECVAVADCPGSFKQGKGHKILQHFGIKETV